MSSTGYWQISSDSVFNRPGTLDPCRRHLPLGVERLTSPRRPQHHSLTAPRQRSPGDRCLSVCLSVFSFSLAGAPGSPERKGAAKSWAGRGSISRSLGVWPCVSFSFLWARQAEAGRGGRDRQAGRQAFGLSCQLAQLGRPSLAHICPFLLSLSFPLLSDCRYRKHCSAVCSFARLC